LQDKQVREYTKKRYLTPLIIPAHNVAIYIPEAHPWRQGGPFLFRDFPGYTLKMVDEHLLRIRVRFDQHARTEWKICLDDFFTGA
jgi:hypothetical protein